MKTTQADFGRFLRGPRAAAAKGFVSGDARRVVELSVPRGAATFLGPGGGIVSGAARVNRTNLAGAKNFSPGGSTRLKVVHTEAGERLAFWTGFQRARVRMPGKPGPVAMNLRVTEIFRKEKPGWKMIHRHADMLARPSAPKPRGARNGKR
ncbi:MAG TPA: nuclear transport factor 2 family protein [Lacunisphaera sp.]